MEAAAVTLTCSVQVSGIDQDAPTNQNVALEIKQECFG
jgi:hypothetical protein